MSAAARAPREGASPHVPPPAPPRTARSATPRTAAPRTATARTATPEPAPGAAARPAGAMPSRPVRVQTSGALPARPLRALPSRPLPGRTRGTGATRATGPTPRVTAPALRLVTGGDAARSRRAGEGTRRAPFVLLVVGLLVATTLGLLVLNTAVAVNSLKATELRTANAEKAEDVQRLEQQVVDGGTPAQLAAAAAAAGLVPAGAAAYLVVAPDGSATLRGTPEPAAAPGEPAPGTGG